MMYSGAHIEDWLGYRNLSSYLTPTTTSITSSTPTNTTTNTTFPTATASDSPPTSAVSQIAIYLADTDCYSMKEGRMTAEEMDRVAGEYTESLIRLIELVRGTGSYLVFAGPGSK